MKNFVFLIFLLSGVSFGYDFSLPDFKPDWLQTRTPLELAKLRQKLEKYPSDQETLLLLAGGWLQRKHLEKAENYLNIAFNRQIDSAFFHYLYGSLFVEKKQWQKAETHLFKALVKSNQEKVEYFVAWCHYLFQKKESAKGIYWVDAGLKFFPMNLHLLTLKSWFLLESDEYLEAETVLLHLHKEYPAHAQSLFNLACIYAKQKKRNETIHYLRKASLSGYTKLFLLHLESDFDFIREDPQFILSLNQISENREKQILAHKFKKL